MTEPKEEKDNKIVKVSREEVKRTIKEMQQTGTTKTKDYAAYGKRKAHTLLLEQKNENLIILFPSVDEPWYKIGWKSAIYYAYDVAPEVCKKKELPTVRKDTDHDNRSQEGIVFVRDADRFVHRIESHGLMKKFDVLDDGIIIIELNRTYTKTEYKDLVKIKYREGDALFSMDAEKKVYPALRGNMNKAFKTILPMMKNLPKYYQDTFGQTMYKALSDMNSAYFEIANSRGKRQNHFLTILLSANTILNELQMIQEIDILNPIAVTEVGSVMVDIKTTIRTIMTKLKKKQDEKKEKKNASETNTNE